MKRILMFVLIGFLSFSFFGCQQKNIIGEWDIETFEIRYGKDGKKVIKDDELKDMYVDYHIVINDDGTGNMNVQDTVNEITYDDKKITTSTGDEFSYKLVNGKLVLGYHFDGGGYLDEADMTLTFVKK